MGNIQIKGIYYVYPKNRISDGFLVQVTNEYEGNDDLSYHGSPWYEQFIAGFVVDSGEEKEFGDQTYNWCDADSLIKNYIRRMDEIRKILY